MTFTHALFVMLLCTVVGSFTWGMRGTIIGGERGALQPGAAIALVLICCSDLVPVSMAFAFAAAIGAAGMFFGGAQTYGETIGLTFDEDKNRRMHGRLGLAIKGANWFGIFGGILGVGLGAMAGRYSVAALLIFVILLPVIKWLGIVLISILKEKVPTLYFSKTRSEVWGGMSLLCLYILIFAAVNKEAFPVLLTVFGFISGGLGFWIGNLLQTKYDGALNGFVSGWKTMECVLGAIGGLGVSFCWCVFYNPFVSKYAYQIVGQSGVYSPFHENTNNILLFVWLLLFVVFVLRYLFDPAKEDESRLVYWVYKMEDILVWPVFCYIPLFLAMTGNLRAAQIQSFAMVLFVVPDKIVFGGSSHYKGLFGEKVFNAVLMLLAMGAMFVQLFTGYAFTAMQTMLMYTLLYLFAEYYTVFNPNHLRSLRKKVPSYGKALLSLESSLSWMSYAGLCCIVILVMGAFYFI